MPWLDVANEVLLDPYFADQLTCTRNVQSIGGNGLAINTPTVTGFVAVVTGLDGDILDRTAESSRVLGKILVHSKFALQDAGQNYDADIVTYNSRQYTVIDLLNYSRFGSGFTCATCQIIPIAG